MKNIMNEPKILVMKQVITGRLNNIYIEKSKDAAKNSRWMYMKILML